MIAIAWRQHRVQLGGGLAVLIALGVLLLWTGQDMTNYLHSSGLSACLAAGAGCDGFITLFENRYGSLLGNVAYLNFLPMLVGLFWGAPLIAREFETGTHRLAWTQSITRRRWLTTKVAVFLGATTVAATAFSLLLSWWLKPVVLLDVGGGYSRMDLNSFDVQGIAPIAYGLFALALGTAAGVLIRRVLPAMAVTVVGFLPLRLWVQDLRGHFQPPLQVTYLAFTTSPRARAGDWILQSETVTATGRVVTDQSVIATCGVRPGTGKVDLTGCMAAHGFHAVDTYQPVSRFWTFQIIEFSIFACLAVALLAVTYYWMTQRSQA